MTRQAAGTGRLDHHRDALLRKCDRLTPGRPETPPFAVRHDQQLTLRWVYLNLIEEFARHNGHTDLIREEIDGATGV